MIDKNQVIFVEGNGFACFGSEKSAHDVSCMIIEDALLSAICDCKNDIKHEKAFCTATRCESFVHFTFEGKKSIVEICRFIDSIAEDIVYGEFAFILPDSRLMLINVDFGKLNIQYSGN